MFAFWHTVLFDTAALCKQVQKVPVTIAEWKRQRSVYERRDTADLSDLGFATLFLNRTNRSGIIDGGVIGGKAQTGAWTIEARFNKEDLVRRIKRIGRYQSRIKLYQMDALDFTKQMLPHFGRNAFVFYDPPYIENGEDLYLNTYALDDHRAIARQVAKLKAPWVLTYDNAAVKHSLFPHHRSVTYGLTYSAQGRYEGREVMFLSNDLTLPDDWGAERFPLSAPRSRHPVYGVMSS